VQYFGAIEPQRRLAPHIHVAMRGAIPRQVIRKVTKATYLQLWWPPFEQAVYTDPLRLPEWDPDDHDRHNADDSAGVAEEQSRREDAGTYRDPDTGFALPTWEQALDALDSDPDARPAVVMRFGSQVDIHGIIAPSVDADRSIRYLTKYLTKDVATTYTNPGTSTGNGTGTETGGLDVAYQAHIDRLHQQVLYLPCSPECANWLRYGIQPKHAGPGLAPGWCASKAHDRENLGLGGRRVQVSRAWSGKTLAAHKADRATVVRETLAAAGITAPDADRMAADTLTDDGRPRFVWEDLPVDDRDYVEVVMATVREAQRWRTQYQTAKQHPDLARASPDGPVETNSATTPPRPPDSQPTQVA
jgi:hypothetical protein